MTYHLETDYFHDPDGTMVCQPKKYIEKLKEIYIRLFNAELSKGLKTPLEKNDHSELQRISAYVIRTKDYATRFRITEPDYS